MATLKDIFGTPHSADDTCFTMAHNMCVQLAIIVLLRYTEYKLCVT